MRRWRIGVPGVALVALGGLVALAAPPAASAKPFVECDGEAVIVAVKNTSCRVGGTVYRRYMRRCARAEPRRLNCTARGFRCRFKPAPRGSRGPGVAMCSRKRKRVAFVVPGTRGVREAARDGGEPAHHPGRAVAPLKRVHAPRLRRCGSVVIQPQSDSVLFDVRVRGIGCRAARRKLRAWGRNGYRPRTGPRGYRCRAIGQAGPGARNRCRRRGHRLPLITFRSGA